ncbi:MAG: prepilin-type N-terminal cleavage/methylation domain-containing protein [Bacillota bacterium]|nr:prepilin-type N-terminal cleavage/methylation domain-containing protein [Bacillota bacterium]MDI7248764.1 prepilin-type N-terminal cleavage/methylation domain-containing protein [Bacillota bacterium]
MSARPAERAGEKGFTLVEVLVAMGLLVVALVPTAAVLSSALRTVGECGTVTNATTLAESLLERLHVVKFADLDPDGDGFHWPRQVLSGYPQFEAEVAVASLGDGVAQVSARLYRRGETEPLVVVSTVRARELPPEGGS